VGYGDCLVLKCNGKAYILKIHGLIVTHDGKSLGEDKNKLSVFKRQYKSLVTQTTKKGNSQFDVLD